MASRWEWWTDAGFIMFLRRVKCDLPCFLRGHHWRWWHDGWAMCCTRCGKSWHPVNPPTLADVAMFEDGA